MTSPRGAGTLLVACCALARPAMADSTDRCIAESVTGQRLVLTRHFVEARPHLVACGRDACPPAVSRDCIERMHEAEASIASVVVSVEDARDARVYVDDSPEVHAVAGEALWVDPGPHRFRIVTADGATAVRDVTVDEGARLQRIEVALTSPVLPESSPHHTTAAVIGASGLAIAGAGLGLGWLARSHQQSERAECATPTACADLAAAQRDYTAARNDSTASTIAVAAGGALLVASVVLWLTAPHSSHATPSVSVIPVFGADRGMISVMRAF